MHVDGDYVCAESFIVFIVLPRQGHLAADGIDVFVFSTPGPLDPIKFEVKHHVTYIL